MAMESFIAYTDSGSNDHASHTTDCYSWLQALCLLRPFMVEVPCKADTLQTVKMNTGLSQDGRSVQ